MPLFYFIIYFVEFWGRIDHLEPSYTNVHHQSSTCPTSSHLAAWVQNNTLALRFPNQLGSLKWPTLARLFLMVPKGFRTFPTECFRIFQNGVEYSRMFWKSLECFKMVKNVSESSRLHLGVPEGS